ncbi:MAG: TonB-dependent receptor [bacterium]|nr:TonB-dependent receptor [bacterium]
MRIWFHHRSEGSARVPWRLRTAVAGLLLVLAAAGMARADAGGGTTAAAAGEVGHELLLFEEFPTVVSAARQPRPIHRSSVPVSIVTAEDIHYGGYTTLAEALQFVPGVDMLAVDRNRPAVGVRGLHDTLSERTLSLIDGRSADSPIFGGSELMRLPLFMEDVERIEVVRGPGGASWGANAFTGVVNVIMKQPGDVPGGLFSVTTNDFGDLYSQLRWGASQGGWSWRLSAGYEDRVSSQEALDSADFVSRDSARNRRFDGEAMVRISDATRATFGLGHSDYDQGGYEFLTTLPEADGRLLTTRAFARLDHDFRGERLERFYLQWYGNFAETDQPAIQESDTQENDLEVQLDLRLGDRHELALGGNLRSVRIDSQPRRITDVQLLGAPLDQDWLGLFAVDRWQASRRLAIETQARLDDYSETGSDWSGRVTGLVSLDQPGSHTLRLAAARAFRTPLPGLGQASVSRIPIDPARRLFAFNVLPPEAELDNEETWSLELGYTGAPATGMTLRLDLYRQRFDRLIGFDITRRELLPGVAIQALRAANLDGADAFGAELEAALEGPAGRLTLWVAYNDFETDRDDQIVRAHLPARHKAGAVGRLRRGDGWTFQLSYKYSSETPVDPGEVSGNSTVDAFHRLDLAAAKSLGRVEVSAGVADLFDDTELTVFDAAGFTAHPTPGRSVFARFQLEF